MLFWFDGSEIPVVVYFWLLADIMVLYSPTDERSTSYILRRADSYPVFFLQNRGFCKISHQGQNHGPKSNVTFDCQHLSTLRERMTIDRHYYIKVLIMQE